MFIRIVQCAQWSISEQALWNHEKTPYTKLSTIRVVSNTHNNNLSRPTKQSATAYREVSAMHVGSPPYKHTMYTVCTVHRYVCMALHMYICTYSTCTCAVSMYIPLLTLTYHACMHTCTHTHKHTYTHTHTHTHTHALYLSVLAVSLTL